MKGGFEYLWEIQLDQINRHNIMSDLQNQTAEEVINHILIAALEEQVKNPPKNPSPQQEYVYQQLVLIDSFFKTEFKTTFDQIEELIKDPNNAFKAKVLSQALEEKKEAALTFIFDNRKHLTI